MQVGNRLLGRDAAGVQNIDAGSSNLLPIVQSNLPSRSHKHSKRLGRGSVNIGMVFNGRDDRMAIGFHLLWEKADRLRVTIYNPRWNGSRDDSTDYTRVYGWPVCECLFHAPLLYFKKGPSIGVFLKQAPDKPFIRIAKGYVSVYSVVVVSQPHGAVWTRHPAQEKGLLSWL